MLLPMYSIKYVDLLYIVKYLIYILMLINLLYDIFQIAFFVGVLLNEICNTVLKHLLQEPRPLARNTNLLYSEYGMPSAHSQFMWFFASYMLYFTFIRFVYNILSIVIFFFII